MHEHVASSTELDLRLSGKQESFLPAFVDFDYWMHCDAKPHGLMLTVKLALPICGF